MISLLLIILYTVIFIFWLLRISRSQRNALSTRQVTLSFITKVAFGMAYGFLFFKFYNGDDTWQDHNKSLIEYQKLLHHPIDFLLDIRNIATGSTSLDALYNTTSSFWNKLDEVLFIKMLAMFNIFSFGHYYVNVVLFCFVVYLGNLLLHRQIIYHFPYIFSFSDHSDFLFADDHFLVKWHSKGRDTFPGNYHGVMFF